MKKALHPFFLLALACAIAVALPLTLNPQTRVTSPNLLPGQSSTILPAGSSLLLGGETNGEVSPAATIWDPRTGTSRELPSKLGYARAWHTATVLPDGTVLILGGIGSSGQLIEKGELFDPDSETFSPVGTSDLTPRARHTATVLTDGALLIAGGVGADNETRDSAELWNYADGSLIPLPVMSVGRENHRAALLDDGRVLLSGGSVERGVKLITGEIFDPSGEQFISVNAATLHTMVPPPTPYLAASLPLNNALEVALDPMLVLRFSKPLRVDSLNPDTVTLSGPKGIERIMVVAAEAGMLAFLTPAKELGAGAAYTVTVNGAIDRDGLLLPVSGFSFTTATRGIGGASSNASAPPTAGGPSTAPIDIAPMPSSGRAADDDAQERKGEKKNGKPHAERGNLPPLRASVGETKLAGQLGGTPAQGADPDFSNVSDILGGKKYLLRQDDLVFTSTQIETSQHQTAVATLYSANSTLVFKETVPWGVAGGVNYAQGNSRTAVGRMFSLPNDVVATFTQPGDPTPAAGANVYDPGTGTANFTSGPYGAFVVVDSVDAAVMADFTGDGYADLVTLATSNQMFGGARIAVATAADVRNISAGLTFGAATSVTPNPQIFAFGTPITVGDFNGDGRPEIALVTCPQTPCSVQIFAVDPNTLAVSNVSSIALPGLTSGTASLAAGRFGATDHDQLVAAYQPASGNAIVATIDFDASLQPSLKAVSQDITGSAGFFFVKAGRLDWFSPYDYAVLVGGDEIGILNFSSDGKLTAGIVGQPFVLNGECVNDVAVGNFNNTKTNPEPPPPTTIDPNLQIAVLTANKCDGGASGGIAVTIYFLGPEFNLFRASTFDVPSNAMPPTSGGLYQNLAVGDLQGRSFALGPPAKVTVTGSVQPQVILGLPPMHIDFIQDADHLPNGAPTLLNLTAMPSKYFSQYDTEQNNSNQSSNKSTTSYTFSTKESAQAKFSYGVPDVASVSVDLKANAKQTHDNSVSTTYNTYFSQQFDVSTQTGFGDVVWYTAKRFNTYAYRVLGQCVPAAGSPAAEGCPAGTQPLYVQFSGPDLVTQYRIGGNLVEWYQPVQEPGNVFSYPGSVALLQKLYAGFTPLTADPATGWATDSSGSTVSVSWSQGSGNSVTSGSVSTQSFDVSTTVSASAQAFGFGADISAGFEYNSSSSISTLNESSSTLGSSTGIKIVKPPFINPGQYAYVAQTYIFGQQAPAGTEQQIPLSTTVKSGGPLWTAFVADPTDTGNGAGAWWAQAYTRPDVALNHPSRWNWTQTLNGDVVTLNEANPSNPADSEFYWMKGLYITPAGANGKGSQIVQAAAGDRISLQARVYNYSLAVMPPGSTVHVRFYGQGWDKDKADFTGAAFEIDEVRLDPIPPFNPSSGEPNWVLASTTLDTTNYADQYLIFWVVVWMEQNGELVPETTEHGLTAIPGETTAPTAVAIERYSNNVGFYKQPFFVCPNPCQGLSAPASVATGESLAVEKVEVAPNQVSIFENVTVTATLVAGKSSFDGVLVIYYDGDPQQGGEAFDAELIPHIRANDAYVNRVKFRPRSCGTHTVFVVAQSTATGTASVTVDCPGEFAGKAEGVGDGDEKGKVRFSGKVPAAGTLDLRVATVTVTALLREIAGGELVRGGEAPFLPVTLRARRGSKDTAAIFETPAGVRPSVEIEVKQRDPKKGEVEFSLKVDRAIIPLAPKGCDPRGRNAVRLRTSIAIEDSSRKVLEVNPELSWRCGRNELRTP